MTIVNKIHQLYIKCTGYVYIYIYTQFIILGCIQPNGHLRVYDGIRIFWIPPIQNLVTLLNYIKCIPSYWTPIGY